MRSISSHWKRDFCANTLLESELVGTGEEDESISLFDRIISNYPSQERYVFSRELRDRLLSAAKNDPIARLILDGLLKGLTISEIREKSGITRSECERVLGKIRRRLREYKSGLRNARNSRKGGTDGGNK